MDGSKRKCWAAPSSPTRRNGNAERRGKWETDNVNCTVLWYIHQHIIVSVTALPPPSSCPLPCPALPPKRMERVPTHMVTANLSIRCAAGRQLQMSATQPTIMNRHQSTTPFGLFSRPQSTKQQQQQMPDRQISFARLDSHTYVFYPSYLASPDVGPRM